MRRGTGNVVAVLLALAPAHHSAARQPSDTAEIAQLINAWAKARVEGDVAFLERFYAPELRIHVNNGGVVAREEDIALFAAQLIKPEYIRDTDVDVRVYGDVAVVSCIESLKGTYRGRPGEMALRMLNVLARRDGRWQLVASQSTTIRRAEG